MSSSDARPESPCADAGTHIPRSPEGPSLPWWWSKDEERYHGPCHSRAQAITEAWSEDERGPVHIIQADQGDVYCALWDAGQIQDQFDEANEELADGDGDPLSTYIPAAEWQKLAEQFERSVRALVRRHGLKPWAFQHQTRGEWVDLSQPALAALPAEAQSLLAELTDAFASEFGVAESYVETLTCRLKVILQASPIAPLSRELGASNASTGTPTNTSTHTGDQPL